MVVSGVFAAVVTLPCFTAAGKSGRKGGVTLRANVASPVSCLSMDHKWFPRANS